MVLSKKQSKKLSQQVISTLKAQKKSTSKRGKGKRSKHDSSSDDETSEDDSVKDILATLLHAPSSSKGRKAKKKNKLFMHMHHGPGANCTLLHNKQVVGVDTDASFPVSTDPQDFIKSLLNHDQRVLDQHQFITAGKGIRLAKAVGPMAISTTDTEDGSPVFIIFPEAVLLESSKDSNDITVMSQCALRNMGVPLRQMHGGGDTDVLLDLRTNKTIKLFEQDKIQVLKRGRRKATDLNNIANIKQLITDIKDGKISPIVSAKLKRYSPQVVVEPPIIFNAVPSSTVSAELDNSMAMLNSSSSSFFSATYSDDVPAHNAPGKSIGQSCMGDMT